MSFHILLLDRAGNNLVNADFSPYSRMFFAVKHIYLTLYIVYICRVTPIYSAPAGSNARARVAVLAALAVCAAVPVCACRYLVNGGLFSPPSVPVWPCVPPARSLPADRRACGRVFAARARVCAPLLAAVSVSRAYNGSFHSPIW